MVSTFLSIRAIAESQRLLTTADRAEGWVFGYIHKFEWLVPLVGIDARDAIAMTLALLIAGAAFLGLALFRQRARGSKTLPEIR